jgi:hypothetical protein
MGYTIREAERLDDVDEARTLGFDKNELMSRE